MIELPKLLYRGDSDNENKRKLRKTLNTGLLLTGLSDGGNGREIFQNPLDNLVHRHVAIGWNGTHFLSFTTDKEKAIYYGGGENIYYQIYNNDNWDFALLTLAISRFFNITQVEVGVYKASYYPVCLEFSPLYTILLIDIVAFLEEVQKKINNNLSESIYNAKRDKEWLIFPATLMRNSDEFTSKLDIGCLEEFELYKIYK